MAFTNQTELLILGNENGAHITLDPDANTISIYDNNGDLRILIDGNDQAITMYRPDGVVQSAWNTGPTLSLFSVGGGFNDIRSGIVLTGGSDIAPAVLSIWPLRFPGDPGEDFVEANMYVESFAPGEIYTVLEAAKFDGSTRAPRLIMVGIGGGEAESRVNFTDLDRFHAELNGGSYLFDADLTRFQAPALESDSTVTALQYVVDQRPGKIVVDDEQVTNGATPVLTTTPASVCTYTVPADTPAGASIAIKFTCDFSVSVGGAMSCVGQIFVNGAGVGDQAVFGGAAVGRVTVGNTHGQNVSPGDVITLRVSKTAAVGTASSASNTTMHVEVLA